MSIRESPGSSEEQRLKNPKQKGRREIPEQEATPAATVRGEGPNGEDPNDDDELVFEDNAQTGRDSGGEQSATSEQRIGDECERGAERMTDKQEAVWIHRGPEPEAENRQVPRGS